jgi:hypothetical protein
LVEVVEVAEVEAADAEEVEVAEVVDQVVEEQRLWLVVGFDETFSSLFNEKRVNVINTVLLNLLFLD